jgi:hypothetical protein
MNPEPGNPSPMNLYKISQNSNNNYDTYDSAVVCAENEGMARLTRPGVIFDGDEDHPSLINWSNRQAYRAGWCASPDMVEVELIGSAVPGLPQGVICASFNAG